MFDCEMALDSIEPVEIVTDETLELDVGEMNVTELDVTGNLWGRT